MVFFLFEFPSKDLISLSLFYDVITALHLHSKPLFSFVVWIGSLIIRIKKSPPHHPKASLYL